MVASDRDYVVVFVKCIKSASAAVKKIKESYYGTI